MLDTPHITQSPSQLIASIHLSAVPWAKMREVMGPGLAELREAVGAQGLRVIGPWFNHHLRRPTDTFDFEICLPVAMPVSAVGRVRPGEIRAATVARTVHHGPFDGLGSAWGELQAWILAQGHAAGADFWECYLVGPETSADPAAWRTELNQPLAVVKPS
jgi:effector-binding domain-containing protein